jgi:hypothetical protein
MVTEEINLLFQLLECGKEDIVLKPLLKFQTLDNVY